MDTTQKQLKGVQWLIPGLTGGLVAATAWQSEQMRPRQMITGMLPAVSLPSAELPALAAAAAAAGVALLAKRRRPRRAEPAPVRPASIDFPDATPVVAGTVPVAPAPTAPVALPADGADTSVPDSSAR